MSSEISSLLAVLVLALVHVCSGTESVMLERWRPRTLSAASGIGVAYLFLELLPALAERQDVLERSGFMPGLGRDVYLLALLGLTVSFWVETASRHSRRLQRLEGEPDVTAPATFWLAVVSFFVFNAATGYAVASPGDDAVEPMWMFVVAMGLHVAINDHSLAEHHGERYRRFGRWNLAVGLLVGWGCGAVPGVEFPAQILAAVLAYLAGGSIMNILRHELPDTDRRADVAAFAIGATSYAILLLSIAPAG